MAGAESRDVAASGGGETKNETGRVEDSTGCARKLRCVVMGDNGSGKTSLCHRLRHSSPPPTDYLPTCLDTFWHNVHVDGSDHCLYIVDVSCCIANDDSMHNFDTSAQLRPLALWGVDGPCPAWKSMKRRDSRGLPQAVTLLCFADEAGLQRCGSHYLAEVSRVIDETSLT